MKRMNVVKVESCQEIEKVLQSCRSDFFNQSLNNAEKIKELSEKFSKFGRVLAAYDGETTAGFIAYYVNNETKTAYISMIIIQKAHQGQGIGSVLLDAMLADSKNAAQQKVRLEVAKINEKAIGFYQKKGFVLEGQASETSDYYSLIL